MPESNRRYARVTWDTPVPPAPASGPERTVTYESIDWDLAGTPTPTPGPARDMGYVLSRRFKMQVLARPVSLVLGEVWLRRGRVLFRLVDEPRNTLSCSYFQLVDDADPFAVALGLRRVDWQRRVVSDYYAAERLLLEALLVDATFRALASLAPGVAVSAEPLTTTSSHVAVSARLGDFSWRFCVTALSVYIDSLRWQSAETLEDPPFTFLGDGSASIALPSDVWLTPETTDETVRGLVKLVLDELGLLVNAWPGPPPGRVQEVYDGGR